MRGEGLEPSSLSGLGPKPSASANSATLAWHASDRSSRPRPGPNRANSSPERSNIFAVRDFQATSVGLVRLQTPRDGPTDAKPFSGPFYIHRAARPTRRHKFFSMCRKTILLPGTYRPSARPILGKPHQRFHCFRRPGHAGDGRRGAVWFSGEQASRRRRERCRARKGHCDGHDLHVRTL